MSGKLFTYPQLSFSSIVVIIYIYSYIYIHEIKQPKSPLIQISQIQLFQINSSLSMGGGAAMRAAGKFAGMVNGSFRGGFPSVPFPEHLTSSAGKAKATRPIAGVFSSSDTQIDGAASSAMVTKPSFESEDWEFADEVLSDVEEPMPRLVFGGAPSLEEAKDATFQLRTAIDEAYLSDKSSGGQYVSDSKHEMLAHSHSGHLDTKACLSNDNQASPPQHAMQAFRLLKESAAAQTVVASIASDPNVWTAVLQNEALVEFLHSKKSDTNDSLKEPTAGDEIPGYHFFDDEMFDEANESKSGYKGFFQDIKKKLEEMMNSLSGFFQNLFGGPGADEGSAKETFTDKAMGASFMGLAVMVIMLVVLKRG